MSAACLFFSGGSRLLGGNGRCLRFASVVFAQLSLLPAFGAGVNVTSHSLHFLDQERWQEFRARGIDTVVANINPNALPQVWSRKLDAAIAADMKLILVLWPMPFTWDEAGSEWELGSAGGLFAFLKQNARYLERVVALSPHDEPYWQNGKNKERGYAWSTPQMIKLRAAIRARLPGMSIYYDLGSIRFWDNRARDRRFGYPTWADDRAYDVVAVYSHKIPYDAAGIAQVRDYLRDERRVLDGDNYLGRPLNIKLWYLAHTFELRTPQFPVTMPNAAQLLTVGRAVAESKLVDGFGWYPWGKLGAYSDWLSRHPELFPAIQEFGATYGKRDRPAGKKRPAARRTS